ERRQKDPSVHDTIMSNIVFAAIFSDGAAAALLLGAEHPLRDKAFARIEGSRSMILPNTLHVMGLDLIDHGYRNILTADVPARARSGLRRVVEGLLEEQNIRMSDIERWIMHPGGRKVIDAATQEFNLKEDTLSLSRETLARIGNVSSATVLFM